MLGHTLQHSLALTVDRPARQAIELAKKPLIITPLFALSAFAICAGLSLVCALPISERAFSLGVIAMRAELEAFALIIPLVVVTAFYLGSELSPRVVLSTFAVALTLVAIAALCLTPLVAFLALSAVRDYTPLAWAAVLLPALTVIGVAGTTSRLMTTLSTAETTGVLALVTRWALVVVFIARAYDLYLRLNGRR